MSKSKKMWIAGAGIVVLGLVVFFSINATRKDTVIVQTSKAMRKDELKSVVSASGSIRAKKFVDLQSEIPAVINDLSVKEGDTVKKGDVLLKLDPIQTEAATSSSRANYEAAMTDVRGQDYQIMNAESGLARDEASLRSMRVQWEQQKNNFAKAQNAFKRRQQMNEDGLISREEYEAAQNDYRAAEAQLRVAEEAVSQAEMTVKTARNNIEQMKNNRVTSLARAKASGATLKGQEDQLTKTILRSPLDGIVTALNVEKGERAVPGNISNPQATLMTISDLSTIQAELKVDETDVVNLSLGNISKIKVDALPDVVFDGEVTEIANSPITSSASSTTQEAKDFKVVITLKDPSSKLRPGMSCSGDIITKTKQNVLVVPIQALTVREVELDKDGKYLEPDLKSLKTPGNTTQANNSQRKANKKEMEGLFIVSNSDKIVRFRPVKTGITGEADIEVLDNLKEGEEVVSGTFQTLRTIKDGAAIKIDNTTKTAADKKS